MDCSSGLRFPMNAGSCSAASCSAGDIACSRRQWPITRCASQRRHLLQLRHDIVLEVLALLRSRLFEHPLGRADSLLLLRQSSGSTSANSAGSALVAAGGKTLELFVILQEALALVRRHVTQILHPFRWQSHG